jgi:hypothetical protein
MAEPRGRSATVTVVAGSERLEVQGRAAVLIALIARSAAKLNAIPVGRLVLNFAHQKCNLELTECFEALRFDGE